VEGHAGVPAPEEDRRRVYIGDGAIITHCGQEIVEGDRTALEAQLNTMATDREIEPTTPSKPPSDNPSHKTSPPPLRGRKAEPVARP
jgi:hypothetical protein